MQGQLPSRKRAAPGASPMPQQQQNAPLFNGLNFNGMPDASANYSNSNDFMNMNPNTVEGLNGAGNPYGDASAGFDPDLFASTINNGMANAASNQLVRRNANQQLAARGLAQGGNVWPDMDAAGKVAEWPPHEENTEDLEQRALTAKKEAQAKRKQIPPFVQKLSSFLDESKNTDLIRWSDDGNSFIVLDEDEFAKTLIPELFKHNNYASFVRQLNMYGFHKRVGLSDNSMKASENKRKTPSEYYNEYFKRGRPELLWLIQKPKNTPTSGKRKKDGKDQGDSDDEEKKYLPAAVDSGHTGQSAESPNTRRDLITLPKSELDAVRQELRQLQQQQRFISNVIAQVKRQNDQLYQQASAFQTLHDRHENSINAILTFLATFYNRSLEGQNGANLADMFSHAIPENMQQHGNVVDVGDLEDANLRPQTQQARPPRRPLALLPAPDTKSTPSSSIGGGGRASTVSPSPASAPSSRKPSIFRSAAQPRPSTAQGNTPATPMTTDAPTPAIKTDAATPNVEEIPDLSTAPTPDANQMMSVINAANNASNTPTSASFDLPAALAQYQTANGAAPLTQQQKQDMWSLIASKQPHSANNANNNALVNPTMPEVPDLNQFTETQEQLDYLHKLQTDNERRVQDLADRLVPLSPTGTIPGLDYDGNSTLGPQMGAPGGSQPPDWSLDDFTNTGDYFQNAPLPISDDQNLGTATGTGDDLFNFDDFAADTGNGGANGFGNFDDDDLFGTNSATNNAATDGTHLAVGDNAGGRVESVASSDPGSPAVEPPGGGGKAGAASPNKRRRVG